MSCAKTVFTDRYIRSFITAARARFIAECFFPTVSRAENVSKALSLSLFRVLRELMKSLGIFSEESATFPANHSPLATKHSAKERDTRKYNKREKLQTSELSSNLARSPLDLCFLHCASSGNATLAYLFYSVRLLQKFAGKCNQSIWSSAKVRANNIRLSLCLFLSLSLSHLLGKRSRLNNGSARQGQT